MKRLITLFLLFSILFAGSNIYAKSDLEGKKVLMIIACTDFRDEELKEPKAIFEGGGASVTVASSRMEGCTGMLGMKVKPDALLKDVDPKGFDAIVFVGGVGAKEYFDDEKALNIARSAFTEGKVLAAICLAPAILAKAGVLKGKKATVYPSEKGTLKSEGAIYTGEDVTVDGNIVTASGPHAAAPFGRKIGKLMEP